MGSVVRAGVPVSVVAPSAASHAVRNDDTRLSDARTPTAHKTSHTTGGSDALTAANVAAQRALTATATKTASTYTAVDGDIVPCDTASNAITVTLPTAAVGSIILVTKINTGTNKVIFAKQAGDAWLNGTPPSLLLQADVRWFYGYSGGWVQVEPVTSVKQFPPFALTDGATPALDASLSNHFTLAASGDRTIGIPSNPTEGQVIYIAHTAVTTARTLALNTGTGGFLFGTTITALTQTVSGKTDIIQAMYNTSANKWWVTGYTKGY